MWEKQKKVWTRYQQDVLATDLISAFLLLGYLRHAATQKGTGYAMELADLQHYKVVRKPAKVRQAMRENRGMPFLFVYGLN